MIRHIVLYHLREEAAGHTKAENAALMKQKLEALVRQIEGLRSLTVAPDVNGGAYDIVLHAVFEDLAAVHFYKKHPAHIAVSEFVHEIMDARAGADCEC